MAMSNFARLLCLGIILECTEGLFVYIYVISFYLVIVKLILIDCIYSALVCISSAISVPLSTPSPRHDHIGGRVRYIYSSS
jgi:hypothetical protein